MEQTNEIRYHMSSYLLVGLSLIVDWCLKQRRLCVFVCMCVCVHVCVGVCEREGCVRLCVCDF